MSEESERYELKFERLAPKAGQVTAFKSSFLSKKSSGIGRGDGITNVESFEIKGTTKVLTWDEANNFRRVNLTLDYLLKGNVAVTNSLVREGRQISAKTISGETFFSSEKESIPMALREILDQVMQQLFPKENSIADDEGLGTDQMRREGEVWETDFTKGRRSNRVRQMIQDLGMGTNTIPCKVQFIGRTNCFGSQCYRLSLTIPFHSDSVPVKVEKLFSRADMINPHFDGLFTIELTVPFERSLPIVVFAISANVLGRVDTKNDGTNTTLRFDWSINSITERHSISGFGN